MRLRFTVFRRETTVFHVRLAGCGACRDAVDGWLRGSDPGRRVFRECSSPRHASLVVVTGCLTEGLDEAASLVVEQAPSERKVVVVGDCATGRGETVALLEGCIGAAEHIHPDAEAPGCPASLEAIVAGVRDVTG